MTLALMGGSLRKASLNLKLMGHLARGLEALGAEASMIPPEALRLPLFDGDLPAPPEVLALQRQLSGLQGLIIVSPEYNAGIPGHLKNAVDWPSGACRSCWPPPPPGPSEAPGATSPGGPPWPIWAPSPIRRASRFPWRTRTSPRTARPSRRGPLWK